MTVDRRGRSTSVLPLLLLAAYAFWFASVALRPGLVFDDHPGQLYRLAHAVRLGLAPWRWNPGWWGGYAELQFYPPGFAGLGAIVHRAAFGALPLERTYQAMVWVAYLLPGFTTYALLVRVFGNGWLALPGAFLALAMSAGSRSGVEEGVRWGLVASRLGWGLLPLLARALLPWVEGARPWRGSAVILGGIGLTHPAHVPAGVCLVILGALAGPGPRSRRVWEAGGILLAAAGLSAFWLFPFLAHRSLALPLAWADASPATLAAQAAGQPLLVLLAAADMAALAGWRRLAAATPAAGWLAATAPCLAALVAAGAMLAPRIDFLWLPADRLMDGFLLALILGGAQVLWLTGPRRPRASARARGVGALALVLAVGMWPRGAEPTLTIVPRPRDWPTYKEVGRGLRLDDLWRALTRLPPGRILFLRSAVPLEFGPHWWRPHTHVTALTPLLSGREIIGGTFTHPSPVAGLLYTGSAHHRAITRLAEQRDGVTLFGRPLDDLSVGEFEQLAERLRISAVVALDEDVGHLPFLGETSTFGPAGSVGPFRIFATPSGRVLPEVTGPEERRLPPPSRAGWVETGLAYSPLWRARLDGAHLPTRANDLGLLMIEMPPRASGPVILDHAPGWAEWTGVALTLGTLALLAATALRRRAGAAPSPWPRSAP